LRIPIRSTPRPKAAKKSGKIPQLIPSFRLLTRPACEQRCVRIFGDHAVDVIVPERVQKLPVAFARDLIPARVGYALDTHLAPWGRAPPRHPLRAADGSERESAGAYLEVEKPQRLVMSWRWLQGGGDPGESRLEFHVRPIAEGTEPTLSHARLQSAPDRP
jgi:hypothetical protein